MEVYWLADVLIVDFAEELMVIKRAEPLDPPHWAVIAEIGLLRHFFPFKSINYTFKNSILS